jgi:chromate reductase
MSDPVLLTISGSLRAGSYNRMLMAEAARLFGVEPVIGDIRLPLYDGDLEASEGIPPEVQKLADQIGAADAVVISCPEYNQSLSGVMKNALDWVSRTKTNPWADKPVAIMAAANGRAGGARSQFALRLALNPFQPRLLTGPEVMVASASKEFDENGRLTGELYRKSMQTLMDKLRAAVG